MFANTSGGGLDVGGPDACLTPPSPSPVPYPNFAAGPTASPAVYNFYVMGAPTHNLASVVPRTDGDNLGVGLGVASGTVMGPSRHLTCAGTVLFGGAPATRLGSTTLQNSTNCPGMRVAPSQVKLVILAP